MRARYENRITWETGSVYTAEVYRTSISMFAVRPFRVDLFSRGIDGQYTVYEWSLEFQHESGARDCAKRLAGFDEPADRPGHAVQVDPATFENAYWPTRASKVAERTT